MKNSKRYKMRRDRAESDFKESVKSLHEAQEQFDDRVYCVDTALIEMQAAYDELMETHLDLVLELGGSLIAENHTSFVNAVSTIMELATESAEKSRESWIRETFGKSRVTGETTEEDVCEANKEEIVEDFDEYGQDKLFHVDKPSIKAYKDVHKHVKETFGESKVAGDFTEEAAAAEEKPSAGAGKVAKNDSQNADLEEVANVFNAEETTVALENQKEYASEEGVKRTAEVAAKNVEEKSTVKIAKKVSRKISRGPQWAQSGGCLGPSMPAVGELVNELKGLMVAAGASLTISTSYSNILPEESSSIKLAKADTTEQPKLVEKFGVKGCPTLKFFRGGKTTDRKKEMKIDIFPNWDTRTLTFLGSSIGKVKADVVNKMGSIAESGTRAFMEALSAGADISLIGQFSQFVQFGGGFYASYLGADKVMIICKHSGDEQYIWESGAGRSFTIKLDSGKSRGRGSKSVLHMEEDQAEFQEEGTVACPHIGRRVLQRSKVPKVIRSNIVKRCMRLIRKGIGDNSLLEQSFFIARSSVDTGPNIKNTRLKEKYGDNAEFIAKSGIIRKSIGHKDLFEEPVYIVRSSEDFVHIIKDSKLKVLGDVYLKEKHRDIGLIRE